MYKQIVLAVILAGSVALAVAAPAEEEVRQAEAAWAGAVQAGDQAKLDKLLGDELTYTHSTAVLETKQQYLTKLKSGAQKYATMEISDLGVHRYGTTAVTTGKIHMTGTSNGAPFNSNVLFTHTWIKKGSGWMLVAHQTTKVP